MNGRRRTRRGAGSPVRPPTGLREAHPAISLFWITLEVGELDCLEPVLQAAQPDGGGSDQAAPVIAGAGDPA